MTRVSLGDASLTNMLSRQSAALRSAVQQASNEVATGRHTDLAQSLRGDVSPLLAVDANLKRLEAYKATAGDAAFQTAAQQQTAPGYPAESGAFLRRRPPADYVAACPR